MTGPFDDRTVGREALVELSREFGTDAFVVGGGGNSSVKEGNTLWVKPSGTVLAALSADTLLPLDRDRLHAIGELPLPDDAAAREALITRALQDAVIGEDPRRPTVESLLHNALDAQFVVHTHPALVNGMACARDGAAVCGRLFPDVLWIPYADPGCTLSRRVVTDVASYRRAHGSEPAAMILENHGIVVAGSTPDAVRQTYRSILDRLRDAYAEAGIDEVVPEGPMPDADTVAAATDRIRDAFGGPAELCVAACGPFDVPGGAISPDHLIFMKAEPLTAEPTPAAMADYEARLGYDPRVVVTPDGVFGVGASPNDAAVSLAMCRDAARVVRLAAAFGGIRLLTDAAREFLENWEMEVYRQKVTAGTA